MILRAFIDDGRYEAVQTAAFLKLWAKSLKPRKLPPLPAEFLLELGAVLRIAAWQLADLTTEMQADFPPAAELLRELVERLFYKPESFSNDPQKCPAPLSTRSSRLWFRHCSWTATGQLGVDVVIRKPDPNLVLDLLIELLAHRATA